MNRSRFKLAAIPRDPGRMPYVQVAPGGRYFITEDGAPFLAIGHNEGMPWPGLANLHYERDIATTEATIAGLAAPGVTVLRIMLEYAQTNGWLFENPVGRPVPGTVLYWDDLIGLCERHGMRLLVLFWDTFFMSRRWPHHPYGRPGSGFDGPGSCLTSPTAMATEKARIRFFLDRWGDSPAIFGYDLWNEIHPYWGGSPEEQSRWVTEMARFVKAYEMERWGKRHLLTVSHFGHTPEGGYVDLLLRHPELDFATTHVYDQAGGSVQNPNNTVDGALVMQEAVHYAYAHMTGVRPYTDTESGPIHAFMTGHRPLPEAVDAEYYHNMSWAHLATGGAGSGMRWPFRHPHTLTPGMHAVQQGMARFLPALDWTRFSPRPLEAPQLQVIPCAADDPADGSTLPVLPFGCGDGTQALVWLLRDVRAIAPTIPLPALDLCLGGLEPGGYVATFWETYEGVRVGEHHVTLDATGWAARLPLPAFGRDLAVAIRPA
jgi:mannan endo-1,4-beta-mannosidase